MNSLGQAQDRSGGHLRPPKMRLCPVRGRGMQAFGSESLDFLEEFVADLEADAAVAQTTNFCDKNRAARRPVAIGCWSREGRKRIIGSTGERHRIELTAARGRQLRHEILREAADHPLPAR